MMDRRSLFRGTVSTAVLGLGSWAQRPAAATQARPTPPASVQRHMSDARLSGGGRFTWFGLTIYEAQLWVGPRGLVPSRFSELPFALELKYARALNGQAIAESSAREMAALELGTEAQRSRWLAQMQRIFPDVRANDRITGLHSPGQSARFVLNDSPIGDIPDPAFSGAFFAIWLDPRTRASELRDALLVGSDGTEPSSAGRALSRPAP